MKEYKSSLEERLRAQQWGQENKKRVQTNAKRNYLKNIDQVKKRSKEYEASLKENDPEKYRAQTRRATQRYYKKNEGNWEFAIQMALNRSRRRAKQSGIPFDLEWKRDRDFLVNLLPFDRRCPILDIRLWDSDIGKCSISIDRFDSQKGYTLDNIDFMSWTANSLKNQNTEETLERLLEYMKRKRI